MASTYTAESLAAKLTQHEEAMYPGGASIEKLKYIGQDLTDIYKNHHQILHNDLMANMARVRAQWKLTYLEKCGRGGSYPGELTHFKELDRRLDVAALNARFYSRRPT